MIQPLLNKFSQLRHPLRRMSLHGLWWLSSPLLLLLLPQAIYVKRTTLRLPEASPIAPHSQAENNTPRKQLWHLGESTVAGVGVQSLAQGLTANLADALQQHHETKFVWQSYGVNGIRLNQLLLDVQKQPQVNSDLIVITMGVNDTTGLTSTSQWQAQLRNLIQWIKQHQSTQIVFTQIPPMMKFPALPAPLRYIIGLRALLMDAYLQKVCGDYDNVHYMGVEPEFAAELMAEDGYHPSALGYQAWAQALAPQISRLLLDK